MNRNLLAVATAAAIAGPGAAFADTTIYGKFDLGLEDQKFEQTLGGDAAATVLKDTWKFKDNNNSSRLGVKGSMDLGIDGLTAIYQLEYGIDPAGTESGPFSERDIFAGLQGGYGTVKFGKINTLVKSTTSKADFFDDQSIGDDQHLLAGETRVNNTIIYSTPKLLDGLTLSAQIVPGQGRTAADDATKQDRGLADTFYASAVWDSKLFYGSVSYGYHETKASGSSGMKFDDGGLGVAYNIVRGAVYTSPVAGLELSALLQQVKGVDVKGGAANVANASEYQETSWFLGAAYSIRQLRLKTQFGQDKGDHTGVKRDDISLGADYKLGKALVAQVYFIQYEDKDRTVGGITDPKARASGVGLQYSF